MVQTVCSDAWQKRMKRLESESAKERTMKERGKSGKEEKARVPDLDLMSMSGHFVKSDLKFAPEPTNNASRDHH